MPRNIGHNKSILEVFCLYILRACYCDFRSENVCLSKKQMYRYLIPFCDFALLITFEIQLTNKLK